MEPEEYKLMYESEEAHWWYAGLHGLVLSTVERVFNARNNLQILDAGCGTGFILNELGKYGVSYGIDISDIALKYCKKRGIDRVARASTSALPFCSEVFDLVVSTDVLYHRQVEDDLVALNQMHRVLKKDGFLIVNVAAHEFLRRDHDARVHTRHRYSLAELADKIKESNFTIIKISYRNSFLLPLMAFLSFLNRGKKGSSSDLKQAPKPINFVLLSLLKMENNLLTKLNFSFGTSVFCIAKK